MKFNMVAVRHLGFVGESRGTMVVIPRKNFVMIIIAVLKS